MAADAISPTGGCWAYVPQVRDPAVPEDPGADPLFPPALAADISAELQPWGPGEPLLTRIQLDTSQDVATSGPAEIAGVGRYSLRLTDGPVVVPPVEPAPVEPAPVELPPVTVEATALFSVLPAAGLAEDEAPQLVRSDQVELEVQAGEGIEALDIAGSFEVEGQGQQIMRLDALVFVVPGVQPEDPGSVLICNGQTEGQPTVQAPAVPGDPSVPGVPTPPLDPETAPVPGINPATVPLPTGVTAEFTATAVRSVTVSAIQGQKGTSAARAGDTLDLRVAGLLPNTQFEAQICAADVCSVSAADLVTDATGAASIKVQVPEALPRGKAKIRITGSGVTLEMDLVVLGPASIKTSEVPGGKSVAVTVEGKDWDPKSLVKIKGLVSDDKMSGQKGITLDTGADGTFTATFEITDPEATQIRVRQERPEGFEALEIRRKLENQVPSQTKPRNDPKGPGTEVPPPGGVDTPAPAPVPAPAPAPVAPVAPPVAIPVPNEVPVKKVDAPPVPEATTEEMSVSEVRLDGESSLGELFGGPSRREVVFLVENTGTGVVTNPLVRLGVGRDAEVDPAIVAAEVGDLQPGARVVVSVDVALPMASFGTYQVVGQVGDGEDTRFVLEWQTYPWGLIALNLAGVALLAWGVRRRQRNRNSPAPLLAQGDEEDAGASVIDIAALDEWWQHGRVSRKVTVEPDDNDSIVDLDAADRWWARRDNKVS